MLKMKKVNTVLYLPIEIKSRELDAKLLLAYYAVKENYRVIIGEHKAVETALHHFPKGIFFSKGYPERIRKRMLTSTKRLGHTLVELDEEGLIIPDKTAYLSDRMNKGILRLVEQEYCWGEYQQNIISAAYPGEKDKCYAVGNPRFDLLQEKFRRLYEEKANSLRTKHGEFILINTRFSLYNHRRGKKKGTSNPSSLYIKKLYYSFITLIRRISEKYPSVPIIIRPHPTENVQSYRKALSNCENVKIIQAGNVIHWILASRLVIHNGCTTGIEAALLGKPVISYMPFKSGKYDVDLPNEVSLIASTEKDLFSFIDSYYDTQNSDHTTERLRSTSLPEYYAGVKKGFAYKDIIHLLNKLKVKSPPLDQEPPSLKPEKKDKIKYRFPYLRKEEIVYFFSKLDEIEQSSSSNVNIRELTANLFELRSD
ncbi:hypothetical protein CEH05_02470 [Halobacillus halophilus]|uniref:Surface carbohydrate biosynthesis protein n=1 Tax=Halobacillus halophilus (strain ATCC 35676 / DSM 2266 / JCM 20832 / KCTC 3685 / LMG 17431 / NBRC 102448 / NCIMB 2269) TaxID=866895 RepID=I0JI66_HALH3|nr:surface carbohydrate biosynthesis protein [Halobacillus halophilus]ASF38027.1 hypothetical protein CEH05_02470 [Halobacillus halophilus]CCG43834.1 conserved hypothetical protein [Halobacillus halophilus DSM 2266]